MNQLTSRNLRWLFTAVVLLAFGFILGTLRVDIFTFAQENGGGYDGPETTMEPPEEALGVAEQLEKAFNFASSRVEPAVVTVYTEKEVQLRTPSFPFRQPSPFDRFFEDMFPERRDGERSRKVTGLGSGVIIRSDGYIITNHHVIQDVDEISVMLQNDEKVEADVVGSDPKTDLAVIKIDRSDLPSAEFTDSSQVEVGQWAIAIGSPFHLRNTVSIGHVSATHRSIQATPGQNSIQYQDFIQTDAAINQGNSGGPLVNIRGKIIGINTMIHSTSGGNQGIGFAISSSMAQRTVEDLIEYGRVKRPWLGVAIQELEPDVRSEHFGEESGVIVSEVISESPADNAGIEQGDLIMSFNDETVESPSDLQQKVLSQSIGDEVTITLKREDQEIVITATLQELPGEDGEVSTSEPNESEEGMLDKLGVRLSLVSPDRDGEFGLRRNEPFFLVEEVTPGSPAQQLGLQEGHLILEADNRTFESIDQLNQYLTQKAEQGGSSVLLLIKQGDTFYYRALPLP